MVPIAQQVRVHPNRVIPASIVEITALELHQVLVRLATFVNQELSNLIQMMEVSLEISAPKVIIAYKELLQVLLVQTENTTIKKVHLTQTFALIVLPIRNAKV